MLSQSPNGKFGFHVPTCDGGIPNDTTWQDDWPTLFSQLLRQSILFESWKNGVWPELQLAAEQVITEVVPRLLGNLTHNGVPIQATLLHGDLWDYNMACNAHNKDLVLYDAGSFWGHNEMDLGPWRADFCSSLRRNWWDYAMAYLRYYPAAEPILEFEDRNRLYSLRSTLNFSIAHPGRGVRQT